MVPHGNDRSIHITRQRSTHTLVTPHSGKRRCEARTSSDNLALGSGEPFLHPLEFRSWSRNGSSRYLVPLRQIFDTFMPDAIIAEGALGLSSTWELGARRALGGPLLLFWTIGYDPNRPRDGRNMAMRQWPYVAAYAPADALVLYGHDGVEFLPLVRRFLAFRRNLPDAALKIIGDQLGKSVRLLGASFDEAERHRSFQFQRHLLLHDMRAIRPAAAS